MKQRQCGVCGKDLPKYKSHYCDDTCARVASNNKRRKSNFDKRLKRPREGCGVCGKELPISHTKGQPIKYCRGECHLAKKALWEGELNKLMGPLVIKNDHFEMERLYGATLKEVADEFNTTEKGISLEIYRALFRFKALWEHHFKFEIPRFEELDDVDKVIISESNRYGYDYSQTEDYYT